ncbi:50S ribosomal protein L4 [candidate division KSB1 bacterium]|nr:50S ribosomal protein L4 [candidate division KSB1 bacterium]
MELDVYNIEGTATGEKMELPDSIFNIEPNDHVIYQAIRAQMTRSRKGTASSKNRALVRGGGRKPWRQKGRGTARAGTSRSPLWVGGGRTFGPQPHEYRFKLPKKVNKLARRSAYTYKARKNQIIIVENFTIDNAKTKEMNLILKQLSMDKSKVLLLVPGKDDSILLASKNIPKLTVRMADTPSTYDILNSDKLLIQKDSLDKIKAVLGS